MLRNIFVAVALVSMLAPTALAGTRVLKKEKRDFQSCLAIIRSTATNLGVAPINIVETKELRVVRFPTDDGSGKSILVTCSKPDGLMIINESW